MLAYFGEKISPHMVTTKEGFLICLDTPIARTGTMQYLARELPDNVRPDGDLDRVVTVTRDPSEVFDSAATASFEGKPVCDDHPPEDVTPENAAAYSKGHIQNVRRAGDQLIADLHITDPTLINEVRDNLKREISCGYDCLIEDAGNGAYRQKQIRGNHVAVVSQGRAGPDVAIKDAAPAAKSERRPIMRDKKQGLFAMFGRAAKDATAEELNQLVQDASTMLDADPVKAPEAEPVKDAPPAPPAPANLPADLPENWQTNQIVSANGTEAGLDEKHGFNYLEKMLNKAHAAINAINTAFDGLSPLIHTHNKSQITDFPSAMTPTAHKDTHATGGADALAAGDVGAATKPSIVTVTFTTAGWIKNTSTTCYEQTVPVAGLLASDSYNVDMGPVGSTDAAAQLLTDAAYNAVFTTGSYIACNADGQMYCRGPAGGSAPTANFQAWIKISR